MISKTRLRNTDSKFLSDIMSINTFAFMAIERDSSIFITSIILAHNLLYEQL